MANYSAALANCKFLGFFGTAGVASPISLADRGKLSRIKAAFLLKSGLLFSCGGLQHHILLESFKLGSLSELRISLLSGIYFRHTLHVFARILCFLEQ